MRKKKLFTEGNKTRENLTESRKQEKKVAKDLGGKVTSGSGNQWHSKGDVSAGGYLVECKTTEKASYSLKKDTFQKIRLEAFVEGKQPVMQLQINGMTLAVLDWNLFVELVAT